MRFILNKITTINYDWPTHFLLLFPPVILTVKPTSFSINEVSIPANRVRLSMIKGPEFSAVRR